MVASIDELRERLEDDEATFTAEEVRKLLDWTVSQELKSAYQTARVANALQQATITSEHARQAMDRLNALWEDGPVAPTLKVISYE